MISIHAPPRGATVRRAVFFVVVKYFNSRPSARGDLTVSAACSPFLFQFTPLREGRRRYKRRHARQRRISIHAPPRGATMPLAHLRVHMAFQFTPLREGRHSTTLAIASAPPFQFTPLREGRPEKSQKKCKKGLISIHAPPRGATAKDMQFLQIFCSTLTNQHGLTTVPRNLSRLF